MALQNLTATKASLIIWRGKTNTRADSATVNTIWIPKPLMGIGYNIYGNVGSAATTSSTLLKSGTSSDSAFYYEHPHGSQAWWYGIQIIGIDGVSQFEAESTIASDLGIMGPTAAVSATSGGLSVAFTMAYDTVSVKAYHSTNAVPTKSDTATSATSTSPLVITGLTAGVLRYVALVSVNSAGRESAIHAIQSGTPT